MKTFHQIPGVVLMPYHADASFAELGPELEKHADVKPPDQNLIRVEGFTRIGKRMEPRAGQFKAAVSGELLFLKFNPANAGRVVEVHA